MQKKLSVSIVISNWNGAHLMDKHLPSVIAASQDAEIVVADDASDDGSLELLRKKFPSIRVIANKKRQGFASNTNRGVAMSKGDIVVLLNTDVEPEKGFLRPLTHHFTDAKVFAVGCLEKSYDRGGIVLRGRGEAKWRRGFFVHWRGEIDQSNTAWVSGGSGAFRRVLWEKLGGMDTLYNPFYWEDIDLSYRALKAGYTLVFEKKSIIGHYHEEGKIKSELTTYDIKRVAYRNHFSFIWKNLSDPLWLLLHCFWTPLKIIRATVAGDILMFEGYLWALFRLPQILRSRIRAAVNWRVSDRDIFLT